MAAKVFPFPIVINPVEIAILQEYDEEVDRIYQEIIESGIPDEVAIELLQELEK